MKNLLFLGCLFLTSSVFAQKIDKKTIESSTSIEWMYQLLGKKWKIAKELVAEKTRFSNTGAELEIGEDIENFDIYGFYELGMKIHVSKLNKTIKKIELYSPESYETKVYYQPYEGKLLFGLSFSNATRKAVESRLLKDEICAMHIASGYSAIVMTSCENSENPDAESVVVNWHFMDKKLEKVVIQSW